VSLRKYLLSAAAAAVLVRVVVAAVVADSAPQLPPTPLEKQSQSPLARVALARPPMESKHQAVQTLSVLSLPQAAVVALHQTTFLQTQRD
jgi:hypothetical protein